jgi:hypothetical protein
MTPGMHAASIELVERFYGDGITDEEWALLQIHMAYCADCESAFLVFQSSTNSSNHPNSFN